MNYPQEFWMMFYEANSEREAFGLPELTPEDYYPVWKQMVLIETGSKTEELQPLD